MSNIGGGIASIIEKNIIYEELTDNNLYISFEHMIIKCTINSSNYILLSYINYIKYHIMFLLMNSINYFLQILSLIRELLLQVILILIC